MPDHPSVQNELKRLVESLREITAGVRTWASEARTKVGGVETQLSRQLDRAAQFLDQAVRAVRTPVREKAPASAATAQIPGLAGTTEAIPLSSLVSFLVDIDASGVLRVYAHDESFVLQFENGFLVYAFGDNPPEGMRLGEVLTEQGAIHRADLLRVLETGWSATDTLGSLLLREGYIEAEQLEAALQTQIQELGKRLFAHDAARFRFYPQERIVAREDVRMNVMGLLLDSARARDEEQRERDTWAPPEPLQTDVA